VVAMKPISSIPGGVASLKIWEWSILNAAIYAPVTESAEIVSIMEASVALQSLSSSGAVCALLEGLAQD
jgi:hypothetical protein